MLAWLLKKLAPKQAPPPDRDWLMDELPTASGGWTHVGFMSESGVVDAMPAENLKFLSEEMRRGLGEEFKKRGYKLGPSWGPNGG